jgi:hypothetical protein
MPYPLIININISILKIIGYFNQIYKYFLLFKEDVESRSSNAIGKISFRNKITVDKNFPPIRKLSQQPPYSDYSEGEFMELSQIKVRTRMFLPKIGDKTKKGFKIEIR